VFLAKRTAFFHAHLRVLHCAPEACFVAPFRQLHGRRYVTIDKYDRIADRHVDVAALPFADASFDVVLSCHVLEHIEDDQSAIAELARVLRLGGWAAVMVPYCANASTSDERHLPPRLRLAINGHPYHYRIYGPDLVGRLTAVGFVVSAIHARDFLSPHWTRRYRINNNILLLCRKRNGAGAESSSLMADRLTFGASGGQQIRMGPTTPALGSASAQDGGVSAVVAAVNNRDLVLASASDFFSLSSESRLGRRSSY
jgi:predicted SAM-dependent methyltransferase